VAYLEDLEAYDTLVEIGYARAAGKRVIVITSPALHKPPLNDGWVAGSGLLSGLRIGTLNCQTTLAARQRSTGNWLMHKQQ
jgi:prophage regulatory protein